MTHECGACDGTGICQNPIHSSPVDVLVGDALGDSCPACGQIPGDPGNCSVCGGKGWQDD